MPKFLDHQKDYNPDAFLAYSLEEFGKWIYLLVKRAGHRTNELKRKKDLYDAKNYLEMMKVKLENEVQKLGLNYEDL